MANSENKIYPSDFEKSEELKAEKKIYNWI